MAVTPVRWHEIKWHKARKKVRQRQQRIHRAFLEGDGRRGRRLQRSLVRNMDARLVAVRRAAEEAPGAGTPGVDGVANLSDAQKVRLAEGLELEGAADDLQEVLGPVKQSGARRILTIPTIRDRAAQTLLGLALAPQLHLEVPSGVHGGLRGRGLHQAYVDVAELLGTSPKWVARTDIADFYESTRWETVDACLTTIHRFREQLHAWMSASAVLRNGRLRKRNGLPQGGPISPMLANLVVAGPLTAARAAMDGCASGRGSCLVYVDDLVFIHDDRAAALRGMRVLREKLAERGLRLSPAKTLGDSYSSLASSCETEFADGGFDFLGARFMHVPADPEIEEIHRYLIEYGWTDDVNDHVEGLRIASLRDLPKRAFEVKVEPSYDPRGLDDGYGFIDIKRFTDRRGVVAM